MRRLIPLGALVPVAVLGIALSADRAGAAAPQPAQTSPGLASFEGTLIDLRDGWGEARACMIWQAVGVVECFRTEAELLAREAEVQGEATPTARLGLAAAAPTSLACSSPLRLYEHSSFGGRQLSFWDRGLWQNLTDWGFNDALSSYQIGSCWAYLAEHTWGGGAWYPGATSPGHWEWSMSSGWNDRMSSIYNA